MKFRHTFNHWSGVAAVGMLLLCLAACSRSPAVNEREAVAALLAEHLAREIKPKSVLVLSNPFTLQRGRPSQIYEFEEAGIDGLKKGFGPGIAFTVAHPPLNPDAVADPAKFVHPGSKTPLSFMLEPAALDQVLAAHPKTDLVVSLIGLPKDIQTTQAWRSGKGPPLALLLPDWRILGSPAAVLTAFGEGKIAAAVVENIGRDGDPALIVTRDNVSTLLKAKPALFGF